MLTLFTIGTLGLVLLRLYSHRLRCYWDYIHSSPQCQMDASRSSRLLCRFWRGYLEKGRHSQGIETLLCQFRSECETLHALLLFESVLHELPFLATAHNYKQLTLLYLPASVPLPLPLSLIWAIIDIIRAGRKALGCHKYWHSDPHLVSPDHKWRLTSSSQWIAFMSYQEMLS